MARMRALKGSTSWPPPGRSPDQRQIRTFTAQAPLHRNTVGLLALGHN
jgi:hypothetical protein